MTIGTHGHAPDDDDPLAGWQTNAELLAMLHVENGMSFASIAELISEGLGTEIPVADVEAACRAIGIAHDVVPLTSHANDERPKQRSGDAAIDPHEPTGCRWIEDDPRGIWSFCQDAQRAGSSYCEYHHRKAYQRGTAAEAMRKAKARKAVGRNTRTLQAAE